MRRNVVKNKVYYDRENDNVPKIELMVGKQSILLENLEKNRSLFEYIDSKYLSQMIGIYNFCYIFIYLSI